MDLVWAPFIITEHGMVLREVLLWIGKSVRANRASGGDFHHRVTDGEPHAGVCEGGGLSQRGFERYLF